MVGTRKLEKKRRTAIGAPITKAKLQVPTVCTVPPSPLGVIGKLPLELREQIYKPLVCSRYWIKYPNTNARNRDDRPKADLSIIRTSKAISNESLNFLYKKGVFTQEVTAVDNELYTAPLGWASLSRVKNLHLQIDITAFVDCMFTLNMKDRDTITTRGIINTVTEPFRDNVTLRDQCVISIGYVPDRHDSFPPRGRKYESDLEYLMSELLSAFKTFTSFQRVYLVAVLIQPSTCSFNACYFEGLQHSMSFLRNGLEPGFGRMENASLHGLTDIWMRRCTRDEIVRDRIFLWAYECEPRALHEQRRHETEDAH